MRPAVVKPAKSVFSSVETVSIIDKETGEIETTEKRKFVTKADKQSCMTFTKMFYDDLSRLYSLSRTAMNLFVEMSAIMSNTNNQVVVTMDVRQKIMERIGVKPQAMYNATRELVKSGLLLRVVNSVYMIDPNVFAVGTDASVLSNRQRFKDLRGIIMEVKYDDDGRKVKVTLEQEETGG